MEPTETVKAGNVKTLKWSKRCKTCQYCKSHSTFRRRIYNSTYFYSGSHESVRDIVEDYGDGPTAEMVYRHLKDHKWALPLVLNAQKAEHAIKEKEEEQAKTIVKTALEGEVDARLDPHVKALDDYITQAEALVKQGQIKITANSFLQAISIRENINKNKKDRSADLIKTLAGLAAPNKK